MDRDPMSSNLLDEAFSLLGQATKLEESYNNSGNNGRSDPFSSQKRMEAAAKYYEACYLMKRHVNRMPIHESQSSSDYKTKNLILDKVRHYEKHAAELLKRADEKDRGNDATTDRRASMRSSFERTHSITGSWNGGNGSSYTPQSSSSLSQSSWLHPAAVPGHNLQNDSSDQQRPLLSKEDEAVIMEMTSQANTRLANALDYDETNKIKQALDAYMEAAKLYLDSLQIAQKKNELALCEMLKRRLEGALDRVEKLKHPEKITQPSSQRNSSGVRSTPPQASLARPASKMVPSPSGSLSAAEISILKRSSLIASGLFMPWSDEETQSLNFDSVSPWTDPDGLLKLSDKQKERFHRWARPSEILQMRKSIIGGKLQEPVMVKAITPYSIRQKYVSDCSFIASLCICAAFERRFKRRLVTSIIYPQDENGFPVYNKSGKYMVKLWLNGIARRVTIDDQLPVDSSGNLICSHTKCSTGIELWVSIIEKAYMKLCGGYDFPGSNSGVDLFSLTGWIPERIIFPDNPSKIKDFETPPERAWQRLFGANSYGDCLITVSTGSDISEEKAKEVGLVTGHAYAVLSAIKTSNGTRLLQLKNPWAHQVRFFNFFILFFGACFTKINIILFHFFEYSMEQRVGKVDIHAMINEAGQIQGCVKRLDTTLTLPQSLTMGCFGFVGRTF
mmetsp:Transcript_14946/g.21324  ORF Transcript_14946/g.21324 Transcript_14946/m.21324 type:complete len:675 (-) Transcript_14946:2755-4779(-)